MKLTETTDFRIKRLTIAVTDTNIDKSFQFEISSIFQEINLYDNLFTPCMSGSILLTDAIGMFDVLNSPGTDKFITVFIDKGDKNNLIPEYKKVFQIYKISNVKNVNLTSKTYIIHFVSPEFLLSEKLKVNQAFKGLYSDFVKTILTNPQYLNINNSSPFDGKSGIGSIFPTKGSHSIIVPNLSPFSVIEWISYKSTNEKDLPDYLFYENHLSGYNFATLDKLVSYDSPFEQPINISPKNVSSTNQFEFLGARNFKVLSSYNTIENLMAGIYGGTFRGIDPFIQRRKNIEVEFKKVFEKSNHLNRYPILPILNKNTLNKFDSRVVTYPYFLDRQTNPYINETDKPSVGNDDNTQDYVYQRKFILFNLMQRRFELVMPGNFALASGYTVNIEVPNFSNKSKGDKLVDEDLTGKYIITGVRHVIRYNLHETIIEVATDSTNKKTDY